MTKGFFITLEGGEGAGKTTQIRLLADKLKAAGRDVVITREPGGTPEAEKIRDLLVRRDGGNWTPLAECLLLFAARTMHVETLIRPALAAGKIVISDRFTDSTRAYQAYGHGFPLADVETLNTLSFGEFQPDLTFILDMDVKEGLARSGKRLSEAASLEDRFENLELDFHSRLRQGYLEIARMNPNRCRVINAARNIDEIAAELAEKTMERLHHAV